MSKIEYKAYNLIQEIVLNIFQWSTDRTQPKWVVGKLEVDAIALLSTKVDAITKRLDQMNVNAVNSSAPSPCEICCSIEHITLNCQVGSPFFEDPNEVNYDQNFNPRPTNDPYSNTYNSGWKNHLNFSYRSNPKPIKYAPYECQTTRWFSKTPIPFSDAPKV